MKKIFSVILIFMFGLNSLLAQTVQVSGMVTGADDGDALPGVSVVVKGTTIGTVTDVNGRYSLSAPADGVLRFTFVGMATREIPIDGRQVVDATLYPDAHAIDEVIVVAYGTAKKSAITGSATQVSGETLSRKNQSELTKALAGEVAGLQVINTSGQPGTTAQIRIRGVGSVNSTRNPLYVVDGLPYDGDISAIDASDIESTTVLKDAAAAALYGARAANGVILITTKKGTKGRNNIEVDVKYGVNTRLIPLYDVIDSPERYTELSWEAIRNFGMYNQNLSRAAAGIFASNELFQTTNGIAPMYNMWEADPHLVIDPVTGRFTGSPRKYTPEKWADHMFSPGNKTEVSLRFSGGADKLTYFTSFGTIDEKGYYIGSDFRRLNARSNLNYEPRDWFKATTNIAYSYMDSNFPSQTDAMNNGFQFVNYMPPIYPVYQRDADGNMIPYPETGLNRFDFGRGIGYERGYASGINPVATYNLDVQRQILHQVIGNVNFEISFLDGFKFISSNGYQYLTVKDTDMMNLYYGDGEGVGRINRTHNSYLGLSNTQMLSYTRRYDNHVFTGFVAHESNSLLFHQDYAAKQDMARGDNLEFSNAITMSAISGFKLDRAMESYFGQLKYDYSEKYFVDFNLRRDGSSRFTKNRWGNFWSAGAAWGFHKEEFMQNIAFVNQARLKASYGTYGNEGLQIGGAFSNTSFYPTQNLYTIRNLDGNISYAQSYVGNPNLTWERSSMLNLGLDFGMFEDRLIAEFEFFKKNTTDMIFSKQVPISLGFASSQVNEGELSNTGFEFNIRGSVVRNSDWDVVLFVNGAHYRNKMVKMPMEGPREKPLELQGAYGWSKGHSIFDYYMREYAGVNSEKGVSEWLMYIDKNYDAVDAFNNDVILPTGAAYLGTGDNRELRVTNMVTYLDAREQAGADVDLDERKTETYANGTLKYIGKTAIPDLSGAFGASVKFRGFDLSAQVLYSIGGYGYDNVYATLMHNGLAGSQNWHKDIEQRWTAPGQETVVPRISGTHDTFVNSTSSRFLTKRNYMALNNVRLSYTFPKKWLDPIQVHRTTVWVSGDNLYITSARKGYHPIVAETGSSDRSQYIPLTTLMCGINVQF